MLTCYKVIIWTGATVLGALLFLLTVRAVIWVGRAYLDKRARDRDDARWEEVGRFMEQDRRQSLRRAQITAEMEARERRMRYDRQRMEAYREEQERLLDEEQRRKTLAERQEQDKRVKEQKAIQMKKQDEAMFIRWREVVDKALAQLETLTRLPPLPTAPCKKDDCIRYERIRTCQHQAERLFMASGGRYKDTLKIERNRWHPDRFASVPEPHRVWVQAQAEELFKCIQHLINGLEPEPEPSQISKSV